MKRHVKLTITGVSRILTAWTTTSRMTPLSTRAFRKAFVGCLGLLLLIYSSHFLSIPSFRDLVRPPSNALWQLPLPKYTDIYEMEQNLPQHNLSLPFPEGQTGRYVRFSNQVNQLGWNNVLNEVLLSSHLAWRAKRSYVFQDYMWKLEHFPWNVEEIPFTPLNALIAGPTAGGPWSADDPSPRAVGNVWFKNVCPDAQVVKLEAPKLKDPVRGRDAKQVMEHWVKILVEHPARCLEIAPGHGDDFPQTFDLWTVSTPLALPLWDEFSQSPVSRLLRTSPLVNKARFKNEHLFFPLGNRATASKYDSMMAIHLRRGDYVGACQHLADWNSTFYMWNLLPELPDPFHSGPPVGAGVMGQNTPENYALYKRRCFPTEEELVTKIMESKLEWETGPTALNARPRERLSALYIMTNADRLWLNNFKNRMLEEGWETVTTTSDLNLNSEQTAVSMAVDMDIGRRAALFIGNGWSSMTSNIVHRRLVDGREYSSIRFW